MTGPVPAFVTALAAAYGVFLVFTAVAHGWTGVAPAPGPGVALRRRRRGVGRGSGSTVGSGHRMIIGAATMLSGAGVGYLLFGGVLTSVACGVGVAGAVGVGARGRVRAQRDAARQAWPRLIEEIRLQSVTVGRSVPQAVFDAGDRAPEGLRRGFTAARREWAITTEFGGALEVLKTELDDPTADAVCETLLIAHEVGGTDVDLRLRDLADDRREDLRARQDARAKLAGAKFARSFVVIVPLAMALVGLQLGEGRAAYDSVGAQSVVLAAFAVMGACWFWAGVLLHAPEERRVFTGGHGGRR